MALARDVKVKVAEPGYRRLWPSLQLLSSTNGELVGGFNPLEKYESNWESSPNRGENKKSLSCHHLVNCWWNGARCFEILRVPISNNLFHLQNPRNPYQQLIIRWSQICLKHIPILHSLAHKRSLSLWQNRLPCYAQKRKGSSSNPLTFREKILVLDLKAGDLLNDFWGSLASNMRNLEHVFVGSKSFSDMIEGTFSWWRIHRFGWSEVSFFLHYSAKAVHSQLGHVCTCMMARKKDIVNWRQ